MLGRCGGKVRGPSPRSVLGAAQECFDLFAVAGELPGWLFPGRASGKPLHTTSLRDRLRRLDIPNLSNRSRAIRELLRQAPPIIVASMLGYSPTGSERIATEYGTTWQRYAAIDHHPRHPRLPWGLSMTSRRVTLEVCPPSATS